VLRERDHQPAVRFALTNGRIILPDAVVTGKAVIIDGSVIEEIVDVAFIGDMERLDVGGRYITPGLIDIHVHGALNCTFNAPTPASFAVITQEHARCGITSLLATLATAPIRDLGDCLEFSRQWMQEPHSGAQVLGVHIEGPYFSMDQRGAQDPDNIRSPDDGTPDLLLKHHDVIRIMTYAPELPGALDLTRKLTRLGIVPSAGHSSARSEDLEAAVEVGLRHIIHLWSGQSSMVREGPWRKPGLLEASLASDRLTAEMIADNRHLPRALMKMAYRCLGAERLCVVSDATSGAGMPEGTRFSMGGMEYEVYDGVGMLPDHTSFAGSTTLLNQMIPILTEVVDIPLAEAVRMASLTPASIIEVDNRKGSIAAMKDADIAIFEDNFVPWRTMIGGQWIETRRGSTIDEDRPHFPPNSL